MNDERTTAYLLNELTEREAEQFEEECFALPEWPKGELASAEYDRIKAEHELIQAELESAEYDLIHAYLKNELSDERRRRFEEHYLTTEARIEKVQNIRSFLPLIFKRTWGQKLLDFVKSLVSVPRPLVPRLAAILVIVGLAATLWFAIRPRAPQTFAHLNLVSTSDKRSTSGPPRQVKLPLAEDALRVSLMLPEPASPGTTYRVQWEDIGGSIDDLDIEQQEANSISVIIPAGELKPGQYVLNLFRQNSDGTEDRVFGNYFFNVVE
jgi:hypothetical protein